VGISDHILYKAGPLTREEEMEMRKHCEIGCRIARSSTELRPIADWVLKHHEWWNGDGYPLGLKGGDIPLECRILAILDAYDGMVSIRPYRSSMSREAAVAEIRRVPARSLIRSLQKGHIQAEKIDDDDCYIFGCLLQGMILSEGLFSYPIIQNRIWPALWLAVITNCTKGIQDFQE
jgi:hypothetical protein